MLKDLFKPRQDRFVDLLAAQAAKTHEGMEALELYMKDGSEEAAERVNQLEKEADELRRIIIDELNRGSATSLEREDIFALSRAIDDVIDYAYTTVDEMSIFRVKPNKYLRRMTAVLKEAAEKLHLGIIRLQDHPQVALDHAARAKKLENEVESIYREALAKLFEGPEDLQHVVYMFKMREIYRHLSNAADRGDEAADVIGDIVVKRM
jgi:predicted phosphate transport protein (TIGR00153 family)